MTHPARVRLWSPLLAIALFPALLQQTCTTPPAYHLTTLEIEAGGLDRVVGFAPTTSRYDVWTTAGVDTVTIRAASFLPEAELDYEFSFGGSPIAGVLGTGGGEDTVTIPADTTGELKVGVKVAGVKRSYVIQVNPSCDTATCDDANDCTDDVCNATTCEFTTLSDGAACPLALSDCSPGNPGAGACQSGLCAPALCPCDGETAYQAVPRECASGAVFDNETGSCTCDTLGASAPLGGLCSPFASPIVAGCELPHPALSAQVAFNVVIIFGTTSPGAGGPGTVDHHARVRLESREIVVWGTLEILERVEVVIGSHPAGTPSTLVNRLDPALSGRLLAFFKTSATVIDLDTEILDATTSFRPASGGPVRFELEDFVFEFQLATNGDIVTIDNCTFDNPGTILEPGAPPADGSPISCPVPTEL